MFDRIAGGRGVVLAAIMAGATLAGVSASAAGECPAGKFKADARPPANHAGKGVTDTVLAAIDLEERPCPRAHSAFHRPTLPFSCSRW